MGQPTNEPLLSSDETSKRPEVRLRGTRFAERITTRIWYEQPSPTNPYIAERCFCHGYDLLDLVRGRSFADVLYLLLRGELPEPEAARLLEAVLIALMNPGPRHPATRAAMLAGIGKTDPVHILPIALMVLGGETGATEVAASMHFIRRHGREAPAQVADRLLADGERPAEGDWRIAPGFGTHFGSIDSIPQLLARSLIELPASGGALRWGQAFCDHLSRDGVGWLATGVAAAAFLDLGFHPRIGAVLFQLASAPGLLAHGLELANKPITAMPFMDQEHYVIEPTTAPCD
jgi:citrate synthase